MIRFLTAAITLWFGSATTSSAENHFLQASCPLAFPEAMLLLQDSIKQHGYTISRVQHVDKGLSTHGYKINLYKVVFFAREKELETIKRNYPKLVPYIPLNITIIDANDSSVISSLRPGNIARIYEGELPMDYFRRWDRDFVSIFERYKQCDGHVF